MSDEPQDVSRRGFLKAAAGTGAAAMTLVVVDTAPASASPDTDLDGAEAVVGAVAATEGDSMILARGNGRNRIRLTDKTRAYSGAFGQVSGAGEFIVGDEVAAEGVWRNNVLEAAVAGSVFRTLKARVNSISRDGSTAYTDLGAIDLQDGEVPGDSAAHRNRRHRLVSSIRPGDVLTGSGWTDPRNHKRYLLIPATT